MSAICDDCSKPFDNGGSPFMLTCDECLRAEGLRLAEEAANFRNPTPPPIPVRGGYYLTECGHCGWIGSSEQCLPSEEDVVCPACCSGGCEDEPSEKDIEAHGEAVMQRILAAEAARDRLLIAFHDAIRRPLGVTPDSGADFYDPRMADEAEERRRLARAGGRHPYQPHKLYPHFCGQCGYPEREALMHLPAASGRSDQKGGGDAA